MFARFTRSEAGAVVAWALGTLTLAAALAPWICRGGQWLASEAALRDWPAVVEWVAESCGRAKFSRFFNRSLIFSALLLLPWLIRRIRSIRSQIPASPAGPDQPATTPGNTASHLLVGFLMAGTMLGLLCVGLVMAGAYVPQEKSIAVGGFLRKVLLPTLVVAPLEEWLFRGVLFGIWLRFVRPWGAVLGTSLMFSLLHFLEPPADWAVSDPANWTAGFQLLGGICGHFTKPVFFISDFATLCIAAIILGWARMRTGSLALSIGLHAGWITILKSFSFFFLRISDHPLRPWWVGDTVRSGALSCFALLLTAALCVAWLRLRRPCP